MPEKTYRRVDCGHCPRSYSLEHADALRGFCQCGEMLVLPTPVKEAANDNVREENSDRTVV